MCSLREQDQQYIKQIYRNERDVTNWGNHWKKCGTSWAALFVWNMETFSNTQKAKGTHYLNALSKEGILYDPRQHRGDGESGNRNNVQLDLNVRNQTSAGSSNSLFRISWSQVVCDWFVMYQIKGRWYTVPINI